MTGDHYLDALPGLMERAHAAGIQLRIHEGELQARPPTPAVEPLARTLIGQPHTATVTAWLHAGRVVLPWSPVPLVAGRPLPCQACGRPAQLRWDGYPLHKRCAERALTDLLADMIAPASQPRTGAET